MKSQVFASVLLAAGLMYGGIAAAQSPADAPVAPRFAIARYVIEGNSLLTQEEIDTLVAPYVGSNRDFGDIQQALEALQDLYAARGYSAVRVLIPEQDIKSGAVRLQVVEARIGAVRVEGNQFFSTENIRASVPSLKEGVQPNSRLLSQEVQLANESPAKQAALSLEASDDSGKVDAVLKVVDEKPWRVSAFLDNTGSSSTGYYRTGFGYQHANISGRDDIVNVQYVTSPDHGRKVNIYGLGYRLPVYQWGGAIDVIAGRSDVNSGTLQNLFTVAGKGTTFSLRYTQTLPRIDTYEQKLSVGWDWRAFESNVQFIGTTSSLVPDITLRPITLTYNGKLAGQGRELSVYGSGSFNTGAGNDGNQAAFDLQRLGAPSHYSVYRYGGSLSQVLPLEMLLRVGIDVQWTRNLLVPGEQFGMGGMNSVRGYLERDASNDIGHRVSTEVYSPDFGDKIGDNWRARGLAFVDFANGRDVDPARNARNGMLSAGVGVRLNQGKQLSVRFDWAQVLNAGGTRPEGKDRLHMAVSYSF